MTGEPPPSTFPSGIPIRDAAAFVPMPERPEVLVVTGMSGAGRSTAAAALEDYGWYVIDNLPPQMLAHLAELLNRDAGRVRRLAAVVDVRSREFFTDFVAVLDSLRASGLEYRLLFLDASDEALVRRFEAVRRPHPLQGDGTVLDGIREERALLQTLRERADVLINTSELNVHELSRRVATDVAAAEDGEGVRVSLLSFGFKHGLPLDADHVADVRFLANPYWISELRHLTGRDEAVREYVLARPGAEEFVLRYADALEPALAGYVQENKRYTTIAIGCTGGKHRSVAVAERLAAILRDRGYDVTVRHRDVGRE